jgi:hypothetical protein
MRIPIDEARPGRSSAAPTSNPAVRGDRSVATCASLKLLVHVAEHGVAVLGRREPPEQPNP